MSRRALAGALLLLVALPAPARAADDFLLSWGKSGSTDGRFTEPGAVALDGKGYVYVGDRDGSHNVGRVQKFTGDGRFVRSFGNPPREFDDPPRPDAMGAPNGLAIAPSGNLFVVEGSNRVSMWSPQGRYLGFFGDQGAGEGQLSNPEGIAIDSQGFVYVADYGNSRVEKFSPQGRYVASIGQGSGIFAEPDQVAEPVGIAVAPDGSLYVSDSSYRRIQHYTAAGQFLGTFGSYGEGDGQLDVPAGVAVNSDGVFIADRGNSKISHFTLAGAFVSRIGDTPGSAPRQFSHPKWLALDCRGSLYVSDVDNFRIQRLGARGAGLCGNALRDPAERLRATLTAAASQSFGRRFAVQARVACPRSCLVTVGGTIRVKGRRGVIRIQPTRAYLTGGRARTLLLAPSDRATDTVLAGLRRGPARASLTVTATDALGSRATPRRSVCLTR